MTKTINKKRDILIDIYSLFCIERVFVEITLYLCNNIEISEKFLVFEMLKMMKSKDLIQNDKKEIVDLILRDDMACCMSIFKKLNGLNSDEIRAFMIYYQMDTLFE